jgi:hypothetical protein
MDTGSVPCTIKCTLPPRLPPLSVFERTQEIAWRDNGCVRVLEHPGFEFRTCGDSVILSYKQLLTLVTVLAAGSAEARAQACDTIISRTGLAEMAGRKISSVSVATEAPQRLPGVAGRLSALHVTTHPAVISRDLLFAAGERIDTIRVAESMRILRHRQYLADAQLEALFCPGGDSVDLVVSTRDRWTMKPNLAVQATASFVGVQEDDLFGSGNSGSISFALREGKAGGALGYESFWFLGQALSAKIRAALYPDGHDLRGRFRNQRHSVFDTWRSELILSSYVRDSKNNPTKDFQSFHRQTALALIGRRLSATPIHVDQILFGADAERATLNAPDRAPVVGPHLVKRDYYGLKVGFARQAAAFDTLTWLIEKQILVDVPKGFEWEALVGAGEERTGGKPGTYLSGWAGKMWEHGVQSLSQLDLWGSGYHFVGRQNWDDASMRGAVSNYTRTKSGVLSAHLLAEKLVNPDPDVRALSNLDISSYAIKPAYRFAEEAYAASLQESLHLRDLSQSLALDGVFFTAASLRRKSPFSQRDHVTVMVVGVGIRVIPTLPGSGAVRLDVMYPAVRSKDALRKPVFALSLSPWLEASRHREDPRLRQ